MGKIMNRHKEIYIVFYDGIMFHNYDEIAGRKKLLASL